MIPAAILALVGEAVPGVTVYDGRVPDGPGHDPLPDRYVAVYIDRGTRSGEAVDSVSSSRTWRWQVTCVAPDRGMAAWLAEQVADALVDVRPTVGGWVCGQIKHTFSQQPQADEQVQERPVVVAMDLYVLLAEKLPA